MIILTLTTNLTKNCNNSWVYEGREEYVLEKGMI